MLSNRYFWEPETETWIGIAGVQIVEFAPGVYDAEVIEESLKHPEDILDVEPFEVLYTFTGDETRGVS